MLTNSARGVWAVTDEGTALLTAPSVTDGERRDRVRHIWQGHLAELREARKTRLSHADGDLDAGEATDEASWKEQLLDHLMAMAPAAFEWLARRLLREADFDSVNVTGKSGDGGIDGLGLVQQQALVAAPAIAPRKSRTAPGPMAARRSAARGRDPNGLALTDHLMM